MRVLIDDDEGRLRARLIEPDDFTAFSVVLAPGTDLGGADAHLDGQVRFESRTQAWADPGWLRQAGKYGGGSRAESFARMVNYARAHGWVDPVSGEIAGHVVEAHVHPADGQRSA